MAVTLDKSRVPATEEPVPVDAKTRAIFGNPQNALEMGFSAAHGARPETFETLGADEVPERRDHAKGEAVPRSIDRENPGLAES